MESRKITIIKYFAGFYNTKIIWVSKSCPTIFATNFRYLNVSAQDKSLLVFKVCWKRSHIIQLLLQKRSCPVISRTSNPPFLLFSRSAVENGIRVLLCCAHWGCRVEQGLWSPSLLQDCRAAVCPTPQRDTLLGIQCTSWILLHFLHTLPTTNKI